MRGGKRTGAGRPLGSKMDQRFRRDRLDIRLPRWLMRWLKGQRKPASRVVEGALVETFNLEGPERKGE